MQTTRSSGLGETIHWDEWNGTLAGYWHLLDEAKASASAGDDVSPAAAGDTSGRSYSDTSSGSSCDECRWCKARLNPAHRSDRVFCSRRCRQAAWRTRRLLLVETRNAKPMRMAYADPPYPGCAWMYRDQPSYAGEVDHAALVRSLEARYDGFALSTSARSLRDVLPLFTRDVRVTAWVKPIGAATTTNGLHNCWEPLIVAPGRELRPGKRDFLIAQPARAGGSDLIGRKPQAFAAWLFGLLGLLPGDQFDDLFPGSGMIGRCWAEVCRTAANDTKTTSQNR